MTPLALILYEILIGNTNRRLSKELSERVGSEGTGEDILCRGYAYSDGKLAFTANCEDAMNRLEEGSRTREGSFCNGQRRA